MPISSSSSGPSLSTSDIDLPIALHKGTRHPISHFVSYDSLSPGYSTFVSSLSFVSLPKSVPEALSHPGWQAAMVEEMSALHSTRTWDLIPFPKGKSIVGCRWVYTVKVGPNGRIDRLKGRLVARGYT